MSSTRRVYASSDIIWWMNCSVKPKMLHLGDTQPREAMQHVQSWLPSAMDGGLWGLATAAPPTAAPTHTTVCAQQQQQHCSKAVCCVPVVKWLVLLQASCEVKRKAGCGLAMV